MPIENHHPGKVRILWSHAYETDGQFVVNGVLKRYDRGATPMRVHVHVLELGQDNRIMQSLESPQLYVPRNRIGKGNDWKRFAVGSATMPQPGSQLSVTVHAHNESHTDKDLISIKSLSVML